MESRPSSRLAPKNREGFLSDTYLPGDIWVDFNRLMTPRHCELLVDHFSKYSICIRHNPYFTGYNAFVQFDIE
jgi:hypothetical protein